MPARGAAADDDLFRVNAQPVRMGGQPAHGGARILHAVKDADSGLGVVEAVLQADAHHALARVMRGKGVHALRLAAGPAAAVDDEVAGHGDAFFLRLEDVHLQTPAARLLVHFDAVRLQQRSHFIHGIGFLLGRGGQRAGEGDEEDKQAVHGGKVNAAAATAPSTQWRPVRFQGQIHGAGMRGREEADFFISIPPGK